MKNKNKNQTKLSKIKELKQIHWSEKFTTWIGSTESIILHTICFAVFLSSPLFGYDLQKSFTVLTAIVSLEAIYLALFIQMSINRTNISIEHVEENIEEISEDIEDIQEDVEEISEDIEDIQEDVEGIEKDIEEIQEDVEEIEKDIEDISEDVEEISEDIEDLQEDVEEISEDKKIK